MSYVRTKIMIIAFLFFSLTGCMSSMIINQMKKMPGLNYLHPVGSNLEKGDYALYKGSNKSKEISCKYVVLNNSGTSIRLHQSGTNESIFAKSLVEKIEYEFLLKPNGKVVEAVLIDKEEKSRTKLTKPVHGDFNYMDHNIYIVNPKEISVKAGRFTVNKVLVVKHTTKYEDTPALVYLLSNDCKFRIVARAAVLKSDPVLKDPQKLLSLMIEQPNDFEMDGYVELVEIK